MSLAKTQIMAALASVADPELGVNIVDLGLIYSVEMSPEGDVRVVMTMTTPACPLHAWVTRAAREAITDLVEGVRSVKIEIVWKPPWRPMMMSEKARRQLRWQP
jgi:metal-sulfur cluster biosynthetic enzyme